MKLSLKPVWMIVLAVLILAPPPQAFGQAPTDEEFRELLRRAEELERR